jgi:recombination protein RecT
MAARKKAQDAPPQTRALSERRIQIDETRKLLESYRPQMDMVLPRHMKSDRMLRLYMNCVALEPKILQCTKASRVGSILQLAQLGLEPGILGHAYLLPYRNHKKNVTEAQIIVGYKGLLKLARNSGEISTVNAHVVYEPDDFHYAFGLEDELRHIPTKDPVTPQMLIYAYAVVHLKDGGVQWEVMNRREILEVKNGSRASGSGPWVTHEAEMWKKTVLRRICKLLPSSIELATAISLDESADAGIPQSFDFIDVGALEGGDDYDQSEAGQSGDATEGATE